MIIASGGQPTKQSQSLPNQPTHVASLRPLDLNSVNVEAAEAKVVQGIMLPVVGGEDSILHTLWKCFVDVQEGQVKWEGWGMPCAVANTEGP